MTGTSRRKESHFSSEMAQIRNRCSSAIPDPSSALKNTAVRRPRRWERSDRVVFGLRWERSAGNEALERKREVPSERARILLGCDRVSRRRSRMRGEQRGGRRSCGPAQEKPDVSAENAMPMALAS
jgi:hypothetical protein